MPALAAVAGFLGTSAGASLAAAGIGAVGSIVAGNAQSSAIKSAANTQAQATAAQLQFQREQADYAKSQLQPYVTRGNAARDRMDAANGLNSDPAARAAYDKGFEESPWLADSQYAKNDALTRAQSSAASLGYGSSFGGSGKALRAAQDISLGARAGARTVYDASLSDASGMGYNAATGQVSAGSNFANAASNITAAGANNQSQLALARGQNTASTIGGVVNSGLYALGQFNQPKSYMPVSSRATSNTSMTGMG